MEYDQKNSAIHFDLIKQKKNPEISLHHVAFPMSHGIQNCHVKTESLKTKK